MAATLFTHSVGVLYKSDEGTLANTTESFTGNAETGIKADVPAGAIDQSYKVPTVTVLNIVSCCMVTTLATTVKTYLATVLKDTLALTAGKQLVWDSNSAAPIPFTSNFDEVRVTNPDNSKITPFRLAVLLTN
jgi:hypothetical protein